MYFSRSQILRLFIALYSMFVTRKARPLTSITLTRELSAESTFTLDRDIVIASSGNQFRYGPLVFRQEHSFVRDM